MNEKAKIFNSLLETFENEDIKTFTKRCIMTFPSYFYLVGASSTAKYHAAYALGELGLARHTCAVVRFLNHIFSIDCYKNDYTSRERDLLRLAGIMHDSRKSGDDKDYRISKYTRFNHPLLAAQVVRELKGNELPDEEVEFIAEAIETHMGQFNTDKRSKEELPTPQTNAQKLLHLADYLASRKDLEVLFDAAVAPKPAEKPTLETYLMDCGRYKGKTLLEIAKIDRSYILWAKKNMEREPARTLLKDMEV